MSETEKNTLIIYQSINYKIEEHPLDKKKALLWIFACTVHDKQIQY